MNFRVADEIEAFTHTNDFGKLKRIDVLRAPQVMLFGRNSTGSAINVVTAKSDPDKVKGTRGYEVSKFNMRSFRATLAAPGLLRLQRRQHEGS